MRRLDEYLPVGRKRLRCGYTTGTCAAAAARAAAELLVRGAVVPVVVVSTPGGVDVPVEVESHTVGADWAECAVRKDAGDDPDVTDGVLVYARVSFSDQPGVSIVGGAGVGRVTRPGLDQPVGEAAINSVPRAMIAEQVSEVVGCGEFPNREHDHRAREATRPGLLVAISVPGGEEIAVRTFNPRLGIEGGISIIGTTGIVKPMSEDAIVESIRLELGQRRAEGAERLVVVPGNYGADFVRDQLDIDEQPVMCSNYVGDTLDEAVRLGFSELVLVGHIGKMAKVAGGIMNTHSRIADCRAEIIAAHAALVGADDDVVRRVMDAATTDAMLDVLDEAGLLEFALDSLVFRLGGNLRRRAGDCLFVEAVVFSNTRGMLGTTDGALAALRRFSHA